MCGLLRCMLKNAAAQKLVTLIHTGRYIIGK